MKWLFFSLFSFFLFLQLSAHDDDKSAGHFIPNQGQWESHIDFKVRMKAMDVFLEDATWTFNLFDIDKFEVLHHKTVEGKEIKDDKIDAFAYRVHFVGADFSRVSQSEKSSFYNNYFLGQDRSKWASKVYGYGEVYYSNIWNKIDLKIYFDEQNNIKYDFVLHPGSDYRDIQLEYEGAECQSLIDGNIEVSASLFDIVEQAPYSYVENSQKEIPSKYILNGNRLTFDLAKQPKNKTIIIDPTLIASTASGSTASCYGHSATYDYDENIFTGAICFGIGYPTLIGAYQTSYGGGGTDIAISKLNPTGTNLIWASYIGGSQGDYPHSLICNNDNEIIVYGSTNSTDYPVGIGAIQSIYGGGNSDICVTKLSQNGTTLEGSTYLGGSDTDGRLVGGANGSMYGHDNYKGEVYCNDLGEIYVSSTSGSTNFPVTTGAYQTTMQGTGDAVVCILNEDLTTNIASTFFGGNSGELGLGIKIKSTNEVVVTGNTESTDLPTTVDSYQSGGSTGSVDGYVAIFSSDLSALNKSTYLSTTDDDGAYFVQLTPNDEVFVLGGSAGGAFPTTPGVYTNTLGKTFIAKLDEDLTTLELSTVIDSAGFLGAELAAFLVDECGKVYYSCYGSLALLTTADAVYPTSASFADNFYVGVFDASLTSLLYGTFYTGNHVDGGTSRFDSRGAIYQGVCHTAGFNIMPGAWSNNTTGGYDVNVFKIDVEMFDPVLTTSNQSSEYQFSDSIIIEGCYDGVLVFELDSYSDVNSTVVHFGVGGTATEGFDYAEIPDSIIVPPGDSTFTITIAPIVDYLAEGDETVIIFIYTFACEDTVVSATTYLIQDPEPIELVLSAEDTTVCANTPDAISVTATATNGYVPYTYRWYYEGALEFNTATVAIDPEDVGLHIVEVEGDCGYTYTDTFEIVNFPSTATAEYDSPFNLETSSIVEGCEYLVLNVTLPVPAQNDTVLQIDIIGGDAVEGIDFYPIPRDLHIAAGDSTVSINIEAIVDGEFEGNETLEIFYDFYDECFDGPNSEIITIHNNPLLNVEIDDVMELCKGEDFMLGAQAIGGIGSYVYTWTKADAIWTGDEVDLVAEDSAMFYLTVRDACGYETFDSIFVEVPQYEPLVVSSDLQLDMGICKGDALPLEYAVTGGSGDFTYKWSLDGIPVSYEQEYTVQNMDLSYNEYNLVVTDHCGNSSTRKFNVKVEHCEIPNIMTPNGDGNNDYFFIDFRDAAFNIQMHIYDRWGKLVYESFNYESCSLSQAEFCWDGVSQSSGKSCEEGVYFYIMEYMDGKIFKGTFSLKK